MTYHLISYMAMQMNEIKEHKYYLSEKLGCDVGYDLAIKSWHDLGFDISFKKKYDSHINELEKSCLKECGGFDNCKGINKCLLKISDVHRLLDDK